MAIRSNDVVQACFGAGYYDQGEASTSLSNCSPSREEPCLK